MELILAMVVGILLFTLGIFTGKRKHPVIVRGHPALKLKGLVPNEEEGRYVLEVEASDGPQRWSGNDISVASAMIEASRSNGLPWVFFMDGVEKKRG